MQLPHNFSISILLILLVGCGEASIVGNTGESTDPASLPQAPLPQTSLPQASQFEAPPPPEPVIQLADPVVQPLTDQPDTESDKQFTVADMTDLVLVTGQSNALGAHTAFDASLDSPHERVFAFTDEGWRTADLHQVWDQDWFPRGHPGSEPSNNFALHIGKHLANRRDDRVIGFILATAPGQGIEHWDGDFFQQINQRVYAAVNQVPHKSGVDGIFWHQGESDAADPNYQLKLNRLIQRFRYQGWYSAERSFICGETAEYDAINRQLMSLNDDGDKWTGCVDSDGLGTFHDGFHFSASGLRELGRRYAEKYLQIK